MGTTIKREAQQVQLKGSPSVREPTIDELLSDPMMGTVLQHARTTADDLRSLMSEARERLAKATQASSHTSEGGR